MPSSNNSRSIFAAMRTWKLCEPGTVISSPPRPLATSSNRHHIKQEFTKGDSPPSNGVVERGLGIIESAVLKVRLEGSLLFSGTNPSAKNFCPEAMLWVQDYLNHPARTVNLDSTTRPWNQLPPSCPREGRSTHPARCPVYALDLDVINLARSVRSETFRDRRVERQQREYQAPDQGGGITKNIRRSRAAADRPWTTRWSAVTHRAMRYSPSPGTPTSGMGKDDRPTSSGESEQDLNHQR